MRFHRAPAPALLTLLFTFLFTLNLILQIYKKFVFKCSFLARLGSGIRIRIEQKCWIRIRIQVNLDPQP
jgi:hypothetical protein